MTLHEAIERILKENGKPLKPSEIASLLNEIKIYQKGDNSRIKSNQISARVNNYPSCFFKKNGLIYLDNWNLTTGKTEEKLCNIISVKLISHGLYFLLERGKAHQQEHAPADVPSRPQILPIDPFLSIFSHMPSPHAIPSTRL